MPEICTTGCGGEVVPAKTDPIINRFNKPVERYRSIGYIEHGKHALIVPIVLSAEGYVDISATIHKTGIVMRYAAVKGGFNFETEACVYLPKEGGATLIGQAKNLWEFEMSAEDRKEALKHEGA